MNAPMPRMPVTRPEAPVTGFVFDRVVSPTGAIGTVPVATSDIASGLVVAGVAASAAGPAASTNVPANAVNMRPRPR